MGIDSHGNNGHSHSHTGCFPFPPIPNFVTSSYYHGNPMGFPFSLGIPFPWSSLLCTHWRYFTLRNSLNLQKKRLRLCGSESWFRALSLYTTHRSQHLPALWRFILLFKAPFIATQLSSTGRPVELSCKSVHGDITTQLKSTRTSSWAEFCRYKWGLSSLPDANILSKNAFLNLNK